MAVIITLALSPLLWSHYYVLPLLPVLWMINIPQGLRICRILGALSMFLSSGILVKVLNIGTYLPYSICEQFGTSVDWYIDYYRIYF